MFSIFPLDKHNSDGLLTPELVPIHSTMGCGSSYIGVQSDYLVTFPSVTTVGSAQQLAAESLKIRTEAITLASIPVKFIPKIGPLVVALISFVGTTDFHHVKDDALKAQIYKTILQDSLIECTAKIDRISDSLARLNQTGLTDVQVQTAISDGRLTGLELYRIITHKHHTINNYPLVTMPLFIRVMNIYYAILKLSSYLDPSTSLTCNEAIEKLPQVIHSYVTRFFHERLSKISRGDLRGCKECLINDEPWFGAPGILKHDIVPPRAHTPPICTLVEVLPRSEYSSLKAFKERLKSSYCRYFKNAFPVDFRC